MIIASSHSAERAFREYLASLPPEHGQGRRTVIVTGRTTGADVDAHAYGLIRGVLSPRNCCNAPSLRLSTPGRSAPRSNLATGIARTQ
jgi:hypothetical protein